MKEVAMMAAVAMVAVSKAVVVMAAATEAEVVARAD